MLAGFSAFKKMAKSFSMVSLQERVGYFKRFSPTSLRPRVTTELKACSMKVMEVSFLYRLKRLTESLDAGILTGSCTPEYLAGSNMNLMAFSWVSKT